MKRQERFQREHPEMDISHDEMERSGGASSKTMAAEALRLSRGNLDHCSTG
jgi:hypothetical protein